METIEQDFTTGSIWRKMASFSFPILWANILQSLYSITDMAVIGHFVGDTGLAAIGNASMLVYLIIAISLGIGMGGTVLIARYKGAGNLQGQQQSATVFFVCSFLVALVVTGGCLASHAPILRLMDVPAAAMPDAKEYMRIISAGIVFIFGYNTVGAILRGRGDSKNPLRFMIVATGLNIGLDILLVGVLGAATKGAAIATVTAQGVAFALGMRHLRRNGLIVGFKTCLGTGMRDKSKAILAVGIPYATQMVVVNISYLIITGMLNAYGVTIAAAAGIGLKINTFAAMPCWAFGAAVTTMTAQNIGAKNPRRAGQVFKAGLGMSLMTTGLLAFLVQLFANHIVESFGVAERELVDAGILYLRICCSVNCLFYVAMYTLDAFAVGAGAAKLALFNSILDSLALRLPLIRLAESFLIQGAAGIYLGQALSPVIPMMIGMFFYIRGRWNTAEVQTP